MTLETRPRDADSAEALARLVADAGDCGSFEYFNSEPDIWTFTCQADERSFTVFAVADEDAKEAVIDGSAGLSPMKAGSFYLVQEARYEGGGQNIQRALDRFPGEPLSD